MFCTNCGSQMPETANFCVTCGSRLNAPAAPPQAPPPPQAYAAPPQPAPQAPAPPPQAAAYVPTPPAQAPMPPAPHPPVSTSTVKCPWCAEIVPGGQSGCPRCGAALDLTKSVTKSGWAELPGRKDMAKIQFGRSSCQI